MLKLFQFVTRRPDQTHAEAIAQMEEARPSPAAAAEPRVLRRSVNLGLSAEYSGRRPDEAPAFDAIGEWWVDVADADSLSAMIESGLGRADEERRFIGTAQLMVAEQLVHVDRAREHGGVKTMFLLTRRPEMTHEQSMAYWHEHHVPLVRDFFGEALVRYATNIGLPANLGGWPGQAPPYDGIAELWLDLSMEEMQETVKGGADILLPDERAFLGNYRWLAVEERVWRGADDAPLPAEAAA